MIGVKYFYLKSRISITELWISIDKSWIFLIQSWISDFFLIMESVIEFIVDYWYKITDIHNWIMDIHNSIMGYL